VAAERGLTGAGIGWRPEIGGVISGLPALGFCEVIAEGIVPAAPPRAVTELSARGVAIVPHGVRLSLGGADPVDRDRVRHLASCAAALDAPLVSEHVAFVRAGGHEAGHLLPVPRTRAGLDALVANVRRTQRELDVPLALEPIATLTDWPEDEYTEPDFLTALLDRTGAKLLLDVANVHANAVNRGQDPQAVLDALPLDRIAYVHVAGGALGTDGLYHDTHTHPVPEPVLGLLAALRDRLPAAPPTLLERDGSYPPAGELAAEFATVLATVSAPRASREPVTSPARAGRLATAGRARPGEVWSWPTLAESRSPLTAGPPSGTVDGPFDRPTRTSCSDLAADQGALVVALVAGGPDPAGFDVHRLSATRAALLRKRAGQTAGAWPVLAASFGADWARVFAAHAAGRPPAGALRDGWDLARALAPALERGAAAELADREAAYDYDGASPPRPRSRAARLVRALCRTQRCAVRSAEHVRSPVRCP
jgi:uncharacterized protein (UPF0276 family)